MSGDPGPGAVGEQPSCVPPSGPGPATTPRGNPSRVCQLGAAARGAVDSVITTASPRAEEPVDLEFMKCSLGNARSIHVRGRSLNA